MFFSGPATPPETIGCSLCLSTESMQFGFSVELSPWSCPRSSVNVQYFRSPSQLAPSWMLHPVTAWKMVRGVKITGRVVRLASHLEVGIYRIVQEAVSNVLRHSKATYACIEITYTNEQIWVRIIDNGAGFEVDKIASG